MTANGNTKQEILDALMQTTMEECEKHSILQMQ